MQDIIGLFGVGIGLLIIAAWVTFWVATFRQAGYKLGIAIVWGILMLIPGLNIIPFAVFAFREWPIRKELAALRTRSGVANESDAYLVMQDALRLELQGKTSEALLKYQEIATRFRGTAQGTDAERSIAALQKAVS